MLQAGAENRDMIISLSVIHFRKPVNNIKNRSRGLRANGTKTYIKGMICCLY